MAAAVAGWDIGGAHLKLVSLDPDGSTSLARQHPMPIWQGVDRLHESLRRALAELPVVNLHAVTMTAELADCFPDRASGVCAVLDSLAQALPADAIRVYGFGGFLPADAARRQPQAVASANWHAAAGFVADHIDAALLADIGSTTTDFIPIRDGAVRAWGYTDRERLQYDELIYSAIVRTPVMAVAHRAPVAERWQHLTSEMFATMADVYRLTGELPAAADTAATADGAGKDLESSARRLARQAGSDYRAADLPLWRELAAFLADRQLELLADAAERCLRNAELRRPVPVIGAGCGRFLIRRIAGRLARPYIDISEWMPRPDVTGPAADYLPAYAVAWRLQQADNT